MNKYPKYKPSGVEWIGEIPEHWEVKRLKYSDNIIMGQSPSSDDYNFVENGFPFIQGNAEFTEFHPEPKLWCSSTNKFALIDDILLSVRAPIGAVNIADQKIGIGRGLCSIRPKLHHKKYLYYFILYSTDELNSIGTGSTYTAISAEDVENLFSLNPYFEEQTAIANFLDKKTSQIDKLITNKQKLIELLKEERTAVINQAVTRGIKPNVKLKPSGIEWLGDIPEHWEVKKLKYVLSIKSGDGIKPEEIDFEGTYPVYGGNGIMGYTGNYNSDQLIIIIGRVGAKCGNVRLIGGKKWISDNALVATLFDGYDFKFTSILLESINLNSLANQNAQPLITGTLVRDKIVATPFGIEEQTQIVQYIESETKRIDTTISKIEKEIELLQEYRTALISEVVSGKLCVYINNNNQENQSEDRIPYSINK